MKPFLLSDTEIDVAFSLRTWFTLSLNSLNGVWELHGKKKSLLARLCIKHTSASLCICLCVTAMLQPDTAEVVRLFILAWPVVSDVKSVFVSLYGPWVVSVCGARSKQPQRSVGYLQPKPSAGAPNSLCVRRGMCSLSCGCSAGQHRPRFSIAWWLTVIVT